MLSQDLGFWGVPYIYICIYVYTYIYIYIYPRVYIHVVLPPRRVSSPTLFGTKAQLCLLKSRQQDQRQLPAPTWQAQRRFETAKAASQARPRSPYTVQSGNCFGLTHTLHVYIHMYSPVYIYIYGYMDIYIYTYMYIYNIIQYDIIYNIIQYDII